MRCGAPNGKMVLTTTASVQLAKLRAKKRLHMMVSVFDHDYLRANPAAVPISVNKNETQSHWWTVDRPEGDCGKEPALKGNWSDSGAGGQGFCLNEPPFPEPGTSAEDLMGGYRWMLQLMLFNHPAKYVNSGKSSGKHHQAVDRGRNGHMGILQHCCGNDDAQCSVLNT